MSLPSIQIRQIIDKRLSYLRRIPWSLGIALGMLLFFLPHPDWHGDLFYFRTAPETLRHPYWARWFFSVLAWLPEPAAYLLLSATCIGLLYWATRVFKGRHWVVFSSYAFAWTLIYGQIDGLVVGGLALAWWAINQRKSFLVGAGLILASIKPQLSIFMILMLWWWSPSRWKALAIPALVAGLSFLQWGWWVPEWLSSLTHTSDLITLPRNLSLWTLTGWLSFLCVPIVYALPLERQRKLVALSAVTAMSVPYFPLPSSVIFLCMPVPVVFYGLLQAPFIAAWTGGAVLEWLRIAPPILLLWSCAPAAREVVRSLSRKKPSQGYRFTG